VAGCNSNGGTRYLQKFCKEIDAGLVGLAIDRGRNDSEFQSVANFTSDGILLRARMDPATLSAQSSLLIAGYTFL
jgi:hypothetical protein